MANDPFYNTGLGKPWSELTPAERKHVLSNTNATYGKMGSRPSTLYLDEASDLRRFTVVRPANVGKTRPIDPVALEALRAYITSDLEVTADLRAKMLPPVRHVTIIERVVNSICAAWGRRVG